MGKQGYAHSPPKDHIAPVAGPCPLCKKKVQSLADHIRRVHKGAKV